MPELIVYSPQNNNRLKYVLDYLLADRCGLSYQLTDDEERLKEGPVLNYSAKHIDKSLRINYSLYLQNLSDTPDFDKELEFNEVSTNFDFLAACFFLLARVEEYHSKDLDSHRRYKAENSILHKVGLLDYPIIDAWVLSFKEQLLMQFGLKTKSEKYNFVSTVDIDHIYAFRHKPTTIKLGSLLRDMLTLKFQRVNGRRLDKDPYDRLEEMLEWNKEVGAAPIFFVLTAQRGAYDKSLPPSHIEFITKISSLAQKALVGIHPSYASNLSPHILKKEKNDLTAIVDQPIILSRQHYLKVTLPDTYRQLIDLGIKEEYSMGYASQLGFRAGTSRPFYWYDLRKDQKTVLKVVPFCIMDVTLKNYLHLTAEQARLKCISIIENLKAVEGQCSIIWHNSSFYEVEGWAGWEEVYKSLLKEALAD